MKIVVFDLDETLGYFTQFSIFWSCLDKYLVENNKYNLTHKDFSNILDQQKTYLNSMASLFTGATLNTATTDISNVNHQLNALAVKTEI